MTSKNIRIFVIVSSALFFLVLGTLFYYAKVKINKEVIKKHTTTYFSKKFPRANTKIGDIRIKLGTSIKVTISELKITLKKQSEYRNDEIFTVNNIKVKVPLTALVWGKGSIDIDLLAPDLYYEKSSGITNWEYAGKQDKKDRLKKEILLPPIITQSKINLHAKELLLSYTVKDEANGRFDIKELKIKNIGASNKTAYDLISDVSVSKQHKLRYKFFLRIVGQVDSTKLLSDGKASSTSIINIDKIQVTGRNIKSPRIHANLKIDLLDEKFSGNLTALVNESSKINSSFHLKKSNLSIEDIDVDLYVKDVANIINKNSPNLKAHKSKIKIKGSLSSHEGTGISPDLTFEAGPNIEYNVGTLLLKHDITGSYKGANFNIKTTSSGMGGNIYSDLQADLNLNKKVIKLSKIKPFKLNINADGIKTTRQQVKSTFYPIFALKYQSVYLPSGTVDIAWKNIFLDRENFSGKATIDIKNGNIISSGIKFKYSKGNGRYRSTTKLYRHSIGHKFTFRAKNLNMNVINAFLPSSVQEITGKLSGRVNGHLKKKPKGTQYNINAKLNFRNGSVSGLKIKKYTNKISKVLGKIPQLKEKLKREPLKLSKRFKQFYINGKFTDKSYKFKKYKFVERKNNISIDGRGVIYPPPSKARSILTMKTKIDYAKEVFIEHFGTDIIPIRFIGRNFTLKPDTNFTKKKMLTKMLLQSGKKPTAKKQLAPPTAI